MAVTAMCLLGTGTYPHLFIASHVMHDMHLTSKWITETYVPNQPEITRFFSSVLQPQMSREKQHQPAHCARRSSLKKVA